MRRSATHILLALGCLGGALSLTMCGGGSESTLTTSTGCPDGICGPGSTSSGMGGATTSGTSTSGGGMTTSSTGMTTSSTSGTTSTTTNSTTMCTEVWHCSPWDTGTGVPASSNAGTRTCVDLMNCGTTVNKPPTSVTLPALDLNYFECNVEPILDAKCGMLGCHGTEVNRALRVYARGRHRAATATITNAANCAGSVQGSTCEGDNSCPCNGKHVPLEWQRNYDAARGFALDDMGNLLADMDQSDLVQQPIVGGKSHAGIHLFKPTDPEHALIKNWLGGATLATCNTGNN